MKNNPSKKQDANYNKEMLHDTLIIIFMNLYLFTYLICQKREFVWNIMYYVLECDTLNL